MYKSERQQPIRIIKRPGGLPSINPKGPQSAKRSRAAITPPGAVDGPDEMGEEAAKKKAMGNLDVILKKIDICLSSPAEGGPEVGGEGMEDVGGGGGGGKRKKRKTRKRLKKKTRRRRNKGKTKKRHNRKKRTRRRKR